MYINDGNIKLPTDPDTIVWKYLDLSKFLDLLLSKKLTQMQVFLEKLRKRNKMKNVYLQTNKKELCKVVLQLLCMDLMLETEP